MSESSVNNRVEQVWSRLAGCYGESLSRKFGDEPPPEWRSAIGGLNDYQLHQGMRRLKFSGKPHVPSLPEFVRLCRTVGHADDVPDQRPPSPHPALTNGTEPDVWALEGNRHLLGYITRKLSKNSRALGNFSSANDVSPVFAHNVKTLVAFKNRWVELVRDAAEGNGVPADEQRQVWDACMREAEDELQREPA